MNDHNHTPNHPANRDVWVTLTPPGNFFFGGQKLTEVEDEKDYYIKSLYYPPQTVILGMLRQELLIQNGLFPLHKFDKEKYDKEKAVREKAARLIGESSFDPENPQQDFGVIENLSPVFITRKDNRVFHLLPKDFGHPYTPAPNGKTFFNHPNAAEKEFLPYFDGYEAKQGNPDMLGSKESPQEIIQLKDIFIPEEQIGIKKGKHGQTEEEGYYKQVFYRLQKGYAFSFYLRLKTRLDGEPVQFGDNFVFIGGERSAFKMEVRDAPLIGCPRRGLAGGSDDFSHLFDRTVPELSGKKILLTSEAYVEPEILELCDFAVTGSVFSRNFRSYVRTTRHYWNLTNRKGDRETPYLGDRYNLLARGTVLYYDNPATLKKLTGILDTAGYKKIGYNYYKIYPEQEEEEKDKP